MRARQAVQWHLVWLFLLLSACGGGGGGETPATNANTPPTSNEPPPSSPPPAGTGATFTLSTDSLTFATANLNSIPPTQTLTATVPTNLSGTLYFVVQVTGPAVISVDNFTVTSSTTGRATVYPEFASKLGAGTHTSTITVTACTNDPTCATGQLPGSPRTVNVTYLASSTVQGDIVMPRVVTANQPGETIIRGRGFDAVGSVHFGANTAVGFTVVSDSEIHAEYGSLPAGSYPVVLNSGSLPFNATLVATDTPACLGNASIPVCCLNALAVANDGYVIVATDALPRRPGCQRRWVVRRATTGRNPRVPAAIFRIDADSLTDRHGFRQLRQSAYCTPLRRSRWNPHRPLEQPVHARL